VAARHGFDLAQQAVEDVAPMGEHIEDEVAPRRLAIVPARPLRRVESAVEHPPPEIEPHRQHPAEELGLVELFELGEPGQEQFVLDDAVLEPGALGAARQIERTGKGLGDRLFEIDVLAGGERGIGALRPPAGGAGVEIDRDLGVGEARVALGAPSEAAMVSRQRSELCRVAAEQHRLGNEPVAGRERQPALAADRHQRAQMLGRAEPSGSTLDDDADRALRHVDDPPSLVPAPSISAENGIEAGSLDRRKYYVTQLLKSPTRTRALAVSAVFTGN